jgi:hypothetical protein
VVHVKWVDGGEVGAELWCERGPNLHCRECAQRSKKCSFVPMKLKDLKRGAEDDDELKRAPRQRRVASPELKGSPSWTDWGGVREEAGGDQSGPAVSSDSILEHIKVLLDRTEGTWKKDPAPDLEQCVMLAHWAAVEASSAVEEEEGRLGKLEIA